MKKLSLTLCLLLAISFSLSQCSGHKAIPNIDDSESAFLDEDGDGLFASCDNNDQDASDTTLKAECDLDEDGFADNSCNLDLDEDGIMDRDLNEDGLISEDERDINCDVCPYVFNPDQIDSDQDGNGDECVLCCGPVEEEEEETTEEETVEEETEEDIGIRFMDHRFQTVRPEISLETSDSLKERMKEIIESGVLE